MMIVFFVKKIFFVCGTTILAIRKPATFTPQYVPWVTYLSLIRTPRIPHPKIISIPSNRHTPPRQIASLNTHTSSDAGRSHDNLLSNQKRMLEQANGSMKRSLLTLVLFLRSFDFLSQLYKRDLDTALKYMRVYVRLFH